MKILSQGGKKDYGDRRKCNMNRKQIKMDWWLVPPFWKTLCFLWRLNSQGIASFWYNFQGGSGGDVRHTLCLTAEMDALLWAQWLCVRVLAHGGTDAEPGPPAPSPQHRSTTWSGQEMELGVSQIWVQIPGVSHRRCNTGQHTKVYDT